MRNLVVLVVFFVVAVASMFLDNVYVLLAAPVLANIAYLILLLLGWPRKRDKG